MGYYHYTGVHETANMTTLEIKRNHCGCFHSMCSLKLPVCDRVRVLGVDAVDLIDRHTITCLTPDWAGTLPYPVVTRPYYPFTVNELGECGNSDDLVAMLSCIEEKRRRDNNTCFS